MNHNSADIRQANTPAYQAGWLQMNGDLSSTLLPASHVRFPQSTTTPYLHEYNSGRWEFNEISTVCFGSRRNIAVYNQRMAIRS